jgi:hypothetical protein
MTDGFGYRVPRVWCHQCFWRIRAMLYNAMGIGRVDATVLQAGIIAANRISIT